MCSVIIPAHNESAVIERCLRAVLRSSEPPAEVLVICNGCTDDTAELASAFGDPVRVIEAAVASKSGALNVGDEAAGYFPRIYLDADIELSTDALEKMKRVLCEPGVLAAAPSPLFAVRDSSWSVRAFYRVWRALPYFAGGDMIGSGVYAVSRSGRARFDRFPSITADDGYVRELFAPHERRTLADTHFTVVAPRQLRHLIGIKTRSRFGNHELNRWSGGQLKPKSSHRGALLALPARRPDLIPSLPVYLYVVARTSVASRVKHWRRRQHIWERDSSSREIAREQPVATQL
ncbi:MAG: glycosyltransferase family 2 protein [Planctomycetota bacterium]